MRGGLRDAKAAFAALLLLPGGLAGQIDLSGGVNVVAQGADVDSIATEIVASLDLFLGVPAGPGRFRAYVEVNTTPFPNGVFRGIPEANTDAGTALAASGDGRAQLSELAYEWRVLPGAELHFGLLDATGYLDVSRISNDENLFFLAVPFVNNPTIEFPDYAPAAAFSLDSRGWIPGTSVVVSGSHGVADNPDRGYRELLDLDAGHKGVFAGVAMKWEGDRYHASLGGWIHDDEHEHLDSAEPVRSTGGAYAVAGVDVARHSLDLRLGTASAEAWLPARFVGLTYLLDYTPTVLGLAWGWTGVSEHADASLFEDVQHAEAFLRFHLHGDFFLTASTQWIRHSGFRADAPTVVVSGARLSWVF